MQKKCVPRICYEDEQGQLAKHCYVIWFRVKMLGNKDYLLEGPDKVQYDFHLAYTGNDGKLHPLGYKDQNGKKINSVSIRGYTGKNWDSSKKHKIAIKGKKIEVPIFILWWRLTIFSQSLPKESNSAYFQISNFKRWNDVRKDVLSNYNYPVSISLRHPVGFTFIRQWEAEGDISINYLKKNGMIKGPGYIYQHNRPLPKGNKIFHISLKPSYEMYFARLKQLNTRLETKIKIHAKKIAYYQAAAAQTENLNNLVWSETLKHKSKGGLSYIDAEARLIRNEVINPMRTYIRKDKEFIHKILVDEIENYAKQISRLLISKTHSQSFMAKYNLTYKTIDDFIKSDVGQGINAKVPLDTRIQYINAYILASRTKQYDKLYKSHVNLFLSNFSLKQANPKKAINKMAEDFSKKAGWFNSFGSEIMLIVNMYGSSLAAKEHADDVYMGMKFLMARGLLSPKGWEDFDRDAKALKKALEGATEKGFTQAPLAPILGEKYAGGKLPKTAIGLKALSKSLHALKMICILTTDYGKEKTFHKAAGDANSVGSMVLDIAKSKKIRDTMEKIGINSEKALKYGEGITTVADWGISLHSLSTEDWKKDGAGFGISFVSCLGKTFMTMGLFVAPPVGLAFAGIGCAIVMSATAFDIIHNYQSPERKAYHQQLKKIYKLYGKAHKKSGMTNNDLKNQYDIWTKKSNRATRTFSYLKACAYGQNPDPVSYSILRATKKEWGDKKVVKIIDNYFDDEDFGLRIKVTSSKSYSMVRNLFQYTPPSKTKKYFVLKRWDGELGRFQ